MHLLVQGDRSGARPVRIGIFEKTSMDHDEALEALVGGASGVVEGTDDLAALDRDLPRFPRLQRPELLDLGTAP
jgi:hypothetical protein